MTNMCRLLEENLLNVFRTAAKNGKTLGRNTWREQMATEASFTHTVLTSTIPYTWKNTERQIGSKSE